MAFQCDGFANPIPAGGVSVANPNHAGRGDGVGVGAATVEQPAGCGQDGWAGVIPRRYAAGFPTHRVRHVVSKGVKADINNNLSERLQGKIRDRDKTLRGLKARDTGQAYVDGLVTHYNYFCPHESLTGKKPPERKSPLIAGRMWRR